MSGWHPDPTGRFEFRYHNDEVWTADVSSAGRRFVDPVPAGGPAPAPSARNGLAVAGMVCGIVAATIAWIPFVVVLGVIVAIVGLALSTVALSRSRAIGRRGFAVAGIVTSVGALGLAVVGIVLTVVLARVVERFQEPGPNDARLIDCAVGEGPAEVVARGEVENLGRDERTYSVLVRLGDEGLDWVLVEDVPAGATVEFEARDRDPRTEVGDEPACAIEKVYGRPPFGLDPELFD